jgi:hypothetical protein
MLSGRDIEEPHANSLTRTVGISYFDNAQPYLAVADVCGADNILFARTAEATRTMDFYGNWMLPMSDPHVQHILEQATRSDRVAAYPKTTSCSENFYTVMTEHAARDPIARLFFGKAARYFAASLREQELACNYFYLPFKHSFQEGKAGIHALRSVHRYHHMTGCKPVSANVRVVLPL